MSDQLLVSPMLGGVLLWLTDQIVQSGSALIPEIPTGTATALLAAPVILWLLPRVSQTVSPAISGPPSASRMSWPRGLLASSVIILVVLIGLALALGRDAQGLRLLDLDELLQLLHWRWPRVCAALAAGAMLAAAGNLIQRLTGNDLASPEILGISSGAALGAVLLFFFIPVPGRATQVAMAAGGAAAVLAVMLLLGRASKFSPARMLLAGMAFGSLLNAVIALLMASGDPRMGNLLAWMAGSTYRVTSQDAIVAVAVAALIFIGLPFTTRWLDILPLGETTSRSLGLDLATSRLALFLAISLLTGTATLIVGLLSFIGLLAPHVVKRVGMARPLQQLSGAALFGGIVMIVADWLGRNVLFPYQAPAGLFLTIVGAPYLAHLLARGTR